MEMVGVNANFLILSCLVLLVPLIWLIASIVALRTLKERQLADIAEAIWALVIVLVPLLGAVAFWMVQPSHMSRTEEL